MTYLLIHSIAHHVMHGIAPFSGMGAVAVVRSTLRPTTDMDGRFQHLH
jgi:hypothetical protein